MQFIQARHYTPMPKGHRNIRLLVVHDMEAPLKPTTAEDVARWFAGPTAPQASAHYCLDNNSIVQGVHEWDIAWAAPGGNEAGLHYEFSGYAAEGRKDWLSGKGEAMLEIGAVHMARRALAHSIPIKHVTPEEIRAHLANPAWPGGLCGHVDITHAFPTIGTHTDPGSNFPWKHYLRRVRHYHTKLKNER